MLESYPINLFPGSIWPICWPASLQVQGFEDWRNIPPAKLTLRPSERQRIIQAPCPGWVQVGPFETMSTWTWVQEQFAYIFWFNTFAWLTQSQINSPTVVLSCHRMIGPTGCCMPSKIGPSQLWEDLWYVCLVQAQLTRLSQNLFGIQSVPKRMTEAKVLSEAEGYWAS